MYGKFFYYETNPNEDIHHPFEFRHQSGKKRIRTKMMLIAGIAKCHLKAGDDTRLGIHSTPPSSNLTGLTCDCVYRIAGIDKELGTQDLRGDLSGFIQIYVARIAGIDKELGTHDLSGGLSGFIQIYVARIACKDMKVGMQDFHGTPPNSNLTGLTRACVYRIAGIDKELGIQDLSGDLSGFIQIYAVRIPCEDRNSERKTFTVRHRVQT